MHYREIAKLGIQLDDARRRVNVLRGCWTLMEDKPGTVAVIKVSQGSHGYLDAPLHRDVAMDALNTQLTIVNCEVDEIEEKLIATAVIETADPHREPGPIASGQDHAEIQANKAPPSFVAEDEMPL